MIIVECSLINKVILVNCVVAGVPAKIIKNVNRMTNLWSEGIGQETVSLDAEEKMREMFWTDQMTD